MALSYCPPVSYLTSSIVGDSAIAILLNYDGVPVETNLPYAREGQGRRSLRLIRHPPRSACSRSAPSIDAICRADVGNQVNSVNRLSATQLTRCRLPRGCRKPRAPLPLPFSFQWTSSAASIWDTGPRSPPSRPSWVEHWPSPKSGFPPTTSLWPGQLQYSGC